MRRFTPWGLLLGYLIAVFVVLGTACTSAPAARVPLQVEDSLGRAIAFQAPPQRIISLSPAHTEVLFALGVGQRVVGADRFSDYPRQATAFLPKVGDAFTINVETIVALEPDLVYVTFQGPVAKLEEVGITVLYRDAARDVEGVMGEIRLLGYLVGEEGAAEALIEGMQREIAGVQARLRDVIQGPRAYYELDPALFSVGPNSFIHNVLELLKVENIAADAGSPYPQLSAEVIIQRDPQVILLADARDYLPGSEVTPASVATRPGWRGISAVREGRVYAVDPDLVSRPGPRLAQGVQHLARLLYPERFP